MLSGSSEAGELTEDGTAGITLAELSDLVATLARDHHVPGAQFAVYRRGKVTTAAVGEAEYGTGRQVTDDLAFPIGSIGKAFTATVAMILVADGDLDLDEQIGPHLPEIPDRIATLTLRQLLSHTSGLESGPDGGPSMRRYVSDLHLIQPPGEGFSYSNAGFVLTGRLIEAVTGMTWWTATESILLRPLKIEPAFVVGPTPTTREIATGHAVNATRARPVDQNITLSEAPAGAIAASAKDLVRFATARILPTRLAEEMRQPVVDAFGLADAWALGLAVFESSTGAAWTGHDGTGDGTWCQLRTNPTADVAVALTSNANTGAGLWEDIVAELGRKGLAIPSGSLLVVPEQTAPPPAGCTGSYFNGDTEYSINTGDDGQLYLAIDGDRQATITFHDGLTFSLRDTHTEQSMYAGRCLLGDKAGQVDRIQVNGRIASRSRAHHGAIYRQP